MKALDDRRFRMGFAVVALFTALAGDAWRYSLSWYGFGAIAAVVVAISIALIVRERGRWYVGSLPFPLLAFAALAVLSITWSFYPAATAIGTATTLVTIATGFAIAIALSWDEILAALGRVLRIILGLSIVFEVIVSLFVRAPILPWWPSPGVDYDSLPAKIPKLLYWSRNELFEPGGKIQGIVGNSSLLGFVALLALIVFGIQLFSKTVTRATGIASVVVAAGVIYLTRSATITIALVVLAAVLATILLMRRVRRRNRGYIWAGVLALAAAGVAVVIAVPTQLLALVGKSPDLTNRTGIWEKVIALAEQRPAFGWGWVSYWVPWVEPFTDLDSNSGVRQLHAHNAWLDVWLQLGILGLIVFGALVLSTTVRAWIFATSKPVRGYAQVGAHTVQSLLPILVMVALLVQSVAESRLLVEYGLVLLTIIAIRTKREPSPSPEPSFV